MVTDRCGWRDGCRTRPNRVQTAVELLYTDVLKDHILGESMDDKMAARWFPFIATLFLFIWFSNLIGYIPLPTNTEHKIDIGIGHIPSFSIYAATANLSIPLVLAHRRVRLVHDRGRPRQGRRRLPQGPDPGGRPRLRWRFRCSSWSCSRT